MFDVVIRGEAVLEGKGTPAFRADVGLPSGLEYVPGRDAGRALRP
jgi:N-acyl-D-aspartate/D-glutamate deacylase